MVNEFDMPAPDISMRYKTQINKKKKKKNPNLESENDSSEFAEGKKSICSDFSLSRPVRGIHLSVC